MLRVRTVSSGVAGVPWYSNWYFGTADTQANADAAVAKVAAFWDAVDGLMDNAVSMLTETEVAVINPVGGVLTGTFTTAGDSESGDSAALPLPYYTQGMIQWNTGQFVAGRRLRGRTFVPGFTADVLDTNGTFTAGTVTGLVAGANALISGNPVLLVWSRTHNVAHTVTGADVTDFPQYLSSRRD